MKEKADIDVFLEHVPVLSVWYKALLTFLYHFIIFVCVMVFFWRVSSTFLLGALLIQLMITSGANVPLIYMVKNIDKIREKYQKKYEKFPWQHLWYHYSYTSPLGCAALYSPLLLKTDYFLPSFVSLPSHFITNSLFPYYVALPLGIIVIIIGILLIKPAQDKDRDMGGYLLVMCPEENRLITSGIYQYIRHPRILSRYILALGFGILANNIIAIGVALIHYFPYYASFKIEDKEFARRFGDDVREYQRRVPALFPKYSNWGKFAKLLFSSREKK